jgi:DNA-binding transcriptional MerR regulator
MGGFIMQINDRYLVSIKEFSDFTGVKQSVLRYYDETNLFHPIARGENNYRYYSLPQIQTIKLIETLRGLKVPLKQIEEIMDSRDPESMISLLTQYEVRLNAELRNLQQSFSIIHTLRSLMQSDLPKDENLISIKHREDTHITLGPLTDFLPDEEYHRPYSNFYRAARDLGVNPSYPIGGYFDTFDEFMANPRRPKRFFSLDPDGLDISPAGDYLVGYTRGGYGETNDLPERLEAYIKEHDITPVGPIYHVFPLNEISVKDPKNYLLRISIRVER